MELTGDKLLLSATDLINFLECEHLTSLDLERAQGRFDAEPKRPDTAELVAAQGRRARAALPRGRCARSTAPRWSRSRPGPGPAISLSAPRRTTEAAMHAGAPVDLPGDAPQTSGWRGHADFLERVERPSDLGDWSYEVVDTKLARSVKPYFVIQLCLYSELLAAIQGVGPRARSTSCSAPASARASRSPTSPPTTAACGATSRPSSPTGSSDTYPDPVAPLRAVPLVGRLRRAPRGRRPPQPRRAHGAAADREARRRRASRRWPSSPAPAPTTARRGIGERTFERLRQQARLQVDQRETGAPSYELLEPRARPDDGPRRGFALLPEPSEGDVFFDIEGDPFYEDGLEYLWGVTYLEDGERALHAPSGAATAPRRSRRSRRSSTS